MYERKVIGLAEAEIAAKAIVKEASKSDVPITVAIVDHDGILVYLARMDNATWCSVDMAIKKAYSSAKVRNHTRAVGQFIQKMGWGDMGSAFGNDVTVIPGGLIITEPVEGPIDPGRTVCYGGIGVSGRPADDDEALAKVGLKALQDFLWPLS